MLNPEKSKSINPAEIDRSQSIIGKKMSRNEPCFCGSGKKIQALLWNFIKR